MRMNSHALTYEFSGAESLPEPPVFFRRPARSFGPSELHQPCGFTGLLEFSRGREVFHELRHSFSTHTTPREREHSDGALHATHFRADHFADTHSYALASRVVLR